MTVEIDLQIASTANELPTIEQLQAWVNAVISTHKVRGELTIRIVDAEESAELNSKYRKKSGPTNVLTFPADVEPQFAYLVLGDIIICAPVVMQQAQECNKEPIAHWAHMVIHGVLHLLGYTHDIEKEAIKMETLETTILVSLGYAPPYGKK